MFRYAGTIFLSAFLLFQVQPMIAKFILPWFGGGPAIWTTCLLFFQVALLLGYAYAHGLSARLAPRNQALVHLVLLGLAILWLPIVPNEAWKPHGAEPPTWRILALLGATIGMPYFVLSSTAPLLQRWFSLALPGRSPYRLYALSNAGSLLALGSYPFLVEPHLNLRAQALAWSAGFGLYVAGGLWCAWQIQKLDPRDAAAALAAAPEEEGPRPEPGRPDLLLWIGLAAFPSLLLLAVTNQMTQEVTPVPFLWVLPLALYLLSFIVCFDHPKWYRREVWGALFAALIGLTGYAVYKGVHLEFRYQVAIYAGVVFAAAMCCHGELVRARPRADQLTIYYLAIAAGGALGGIFVALVAPRIFHTFLELQVGLIGCAVLAGLAVLRDRKNWPRWYAFVWPTPILAFCAALGAAVYYGLKEDVTVVDCRRNFYGVLRVLEESDDHGAYKSLEHGRIRHGVQYLDAEHRGAPTSYYVPNSGVGLALRFHPRREGLTGEASLKIGVIGLGAGTLAAYGRKGDVLRFYEIDPKAVEMSGRHFSYCRDTPARVNLVLGDARVMLERERNEGQAQGFDVLAVDAFSSDAIPMHLLTRECFDLYWEHLQPDGVLCVHVSNRFLELKPLVEGLALGRGFHALYVDNDEDDVIGADPNGWMLVTRNRAFLEAPEVKRLESKWERPKPMPEPWTDDYASLFSVLKS